MSLADDIKAMERHKANGTLKEWFEGTAPSLSEPWPLDRSERPVGSPYRFIMQREG